MLLGQLPKFRKKLKYEQQHIELIQGQKHCSRGKRYHVLLIIIKDHGNTGQIDSIDFQIKELTSEKMLFFKFVKRSIDLCGKGE